MSILPRILMADGTTSKAGRFLSHHPTKDEAREEGRSEAKRDEAEHKIHNTDGKIKESNSYGNDPFPPKG